MPSVQFADYWLARLTAAQPRLWWMLGAIETQWYQRRLNRLAIERPIFITGLARSGSTMLLELLAQTPGVATHRYRDFPFITTPLWWNHYLDRTARKSTPQPRAHGDLIRITPDSPEGMEEMLWDRYLQPVNERQSAEFAHSYAAHIRKILSLRNGQRYVSKNNYHIGRIERLNELLPDAHFVIPVRHPASQVESLVRQHARFTELAQRDTRIPYLLAAAGHYEFGPQRKAHGLTPAVGQVIERLWAEGDQYGGYAAWWCEVYRQVLHWQFDPRLAGRVHVVPYEAFCCQPRAWWTALMSSLGLVGADVSLAHIAKVPNPVASSGEHQRVWQATAAIAERLGYSADANRQPAPADQVGSESR